MLVSMNEPHLRGIPLRPDASVLRHEQTQSLYRALIATALGRMRNKPAADMVRSLWPDDGGAKWLTRAPTTPLDRSQYPQLTAINLLPLIAPRSAASQLFELALRLNFAGLNTISVPNAAEVPGALFVGEGKPIPVSQAGLVAATIGPVRKLALITGITREVEEASPENAASLIGRLMSTGASRALDRKVFSADAATVDAPAGLLNGVTPIVADTGTGSAGMTADLVALLSAITSANVIGDIVLVANPARALAIALLSFGALPNAVLVSSQIPPGDVIAIAVDGVASGYDGVPTIEASNVPEIHFADPALPINEGGVLASPSWSSFQRDLVLLKLRTQCAWGLTQPGSVQVIHNVNW
jgi:Phage capsid family